MITAAEARELAKRYRNQAKRIGVAARRKNVLQNIARSYSALANQLEMLEEARSPANDLSDTYPAS